MIGVDVVRDVDGIVGICEMMAVLVDGGVEFTLYLEGPESVACVSAYDVCGDGELSFLFSLGVELLSFWDKGMWAIWDRK